MKKFSILILAACSLMVAACAKKEKTVSPSYRKLTEAVYASGNLYPKNDYKVFANADGFLIEAYVSEGDKITAGQVLFRIDSDKQMARYQTSSDIYQRTLDNYKPNSPALNELEANIINAKNKYLNDSVNYIRYKNLYDNQATSQSEYDKAVLSFSTSRNDYFAKLNNYQKVKNQLFVDMKNAESLYRVNAKDEDNSKVRSFINGMVYEVYKHRGEAVRPNDAIALVGDMKELYVSLKVDELDINRVKIGQEVLIKVDVYKDKIFKARVTKIFPKLTKEDQSFRVDVEFVGDMPEAYYGLSVEANIIISQKDKALTIPKTSLVGNDSVMVQTEKGFEKIKIQKGAEDLEYVEVLSGINTSSVIIRK